MGSYLNPGSKGFQESLNSEIYMDKTGLIEKTNAVLNTRQKFLCVSRPRRFVKSMAADMLAAYYAAKEELFEALSPAWISGVTLSGGDPLHWQNRKETGNLIEEIHEKFPEKTIWLYTGFLWEDIKDLPFLKYVDVLVDGPFVEAEKDVTLHWKGSANQRVIDVKKTLAQGSAVLYESK